MAQTAAALTVSLGLSNEDFIKKLTDSKNGIKQLAIDTKKQIADLNHDLEVARIRGDRNRIIEIESQKQVAQESFELRRRHNQDILKAEEAIREREVELERQKQLKLAAIREAAAREQVSGARSGALTNVGFQVQDIATQLASGTTIGQTLAQQLPQLASGFGAVGIAVGTVAAISIPLLIAALKTLDVDTRDVTEATNDLQKSLKEGISIKNDLVKSTVTLSETYGENAIQARKYLEQLREINRQEQLKARVQAASELSGAGVLADLDSLIRTRQAIESSLERDGEKNLALTKKSAEEFAQLSLAYREGAISAQDYIEKVVGLETVTGVLSTKQLELRKQLIETALAFKKVGDEGKAALDAIKANIERTQTETRFDKEIAAARRKGEEEVAINREAEKQKELIRQEFASKLAKAQAGQEGLLQQELTEKLKQVEQQRQDRIADVRKKNSDKARDDWVAYWTARAEEQLKALTDADNEEIANLQEVERIKREEAQKTNALIVAGIKDQFDAEDRARNAANDLQFKAVDDPRIQIDREKELLKYAVDPRRLDIERQVYEFKRLNTEASEDQIDAYRSQITVLSSLRDEAAKLKETAAVFENAFLSAFDQLVTTGKIQFKELTRSIIADLLRIQLKRSFTTLIGSFFGIPAFAEGGQPPIGKPALVGERGPELFVPKQQGTIIPANQTAAMLGGMGGTQQVTYNINAVDAQSVRQLILSNFQAVHSAAEYGRKFTPRRAA